MPWLGDEVRFIAALEANLSFKSAIWLQLGPSLARGLFHFVVARPGELYGVTVGCAMDRTRDASKGELTSGFVEQNVSRPHHVGKVGFIVRHLDDAPLALDAHGVAPRSLGRRIRS